MVTTNIFRIAASKWTPEDKFTANLHHLIDRLPSIGQAMVNAIAKSAGIDPSTFVRAENHPSGDNESKPDFLLSCRDYDLLCEHKLESDLGKRQLERYLALPKERPTFLVLISNRNHVVSKEVLNNVNYLRPRDSRAPYFAWEHFFPLVTANEDRLAKDFAEYMDDLGMVPLRVPENWAPIFSVPEMAEVLYDCTKELRAYFTQMGAKCKSAPKRLGFEVKYPVPWLHLLYFDITRTITPPVSEFRGPYISAYVWVKQSDAQKLQGFRGRTDQLQSGVGLIIGRTMDDVARWDSNLRLVYMCIGSLESCLTADAARTEAMLLEFGRTVYDHVIKVSK